MDHFIILKKEDLSELGHLFRDIQGSTTDAALIASTKSPPVYDYFPSEMPIEEIAGSLLEKKGEEPHNIVLVSIGSYPL